MIPQFISVSNFKGSNQDVEKKLDGWIGGY